MTSTLDGTPLRIAIERIATHSQLDLWFDRTIDPTAPVSPGPVGPTVHDCLRQIARERDAVIFPLEQVVLIGTAERVDAAAAAILRSVTPSGDGQAGSAPASAEPVSWPTLATPTEALQAVLGPSRSLSITPPLPHDLWPAVTWQHLDRSTAAVLVLAQCGRQVTEPGPLAVFGTQSVRVDHEPLEGASGRWAYRYVIDAVPAAARQAVIAVDPRASFRREPGEMHLRSTATGHRLFTESLLQSLTVDDPHVVAGGRVEALRQDPRRFTLRLINKPAREVLASLAATAQVGFEVDPEAVPASQQLITLEAVEASLMELIEQVAELANLTVVWEQDRFRLTP